MTKALAAASSEPMAGSRVGTFAKVALRRVGAAGTAVVEIGAWVVVVIGAPGAGVIAYHAPPATTTIMMMTAIAI